MQQMHLNFFALSTRFQTLWNPEGTPRVELFWENAAIFPV